MLYLFIFLVDLVMNINTINNNFNSNFKSIEVNSEENKTNILRQSKTSLKSSNNYISKNTNNANANANANNANANNANNNQNPGLSNKIIYSTNGHGQSTNNNNLFNSGMIMNSLANQPNSVRNSNSKNKPGNIGSFPTSNLNNNQNNNFINSYNNNGLMSTKMFSQQNKDSLLRNSYNASTTNLKSNSNNFKSFSNYEINRVKEVSNVAYNARVMRK